MSKHSIRSGSDSRLSVSRSCSSASTRRSRRCSPCARSLVSDVERVLVGEPLQAPLLAALGRPDLDPRAAPLRQELRERREVARVARDDDLRRHARRAAVVLEPERLEDRRHVLAADVLEVERVAVDHLAAAQREDLDDGAVALGREADHVDRPDRLPLDAPAARRGAGRRRAGCGSAPRPRSARPPPPPASAARARAGSASRRRRGTRSRRRRSPR